MIPGLPPFDLTYQPCYWDLPGPAAALLQNVKGAMRREMILDLLASGIPMAPSVLADHMDPEERRPLELQDPRWMGGEYLPDYLPGEVEIARIITASTTMDVIAIRARRSGPRCIHYRVVDEYRTEYTFRPESSEAPLTMDRMIGLLDNLGLAGQDTGAGLVTELWLGQLRESFPEDASRFAWVESVVYPSLWAYYNARAAGWAAEQQNILDREMGL